MRTPILLTLAAALLVLAGGGHAPGVEPGPTRLSYADGPGEQLMAMGPGRFLGTGPFQCLGMPTKAAFNPSATLIAAVSWEGNGRDWDRTGPGWEVFSVPAGVRQQVDLPPDLESMQSIYQIAWLDDHRLLLLGYGNLTVVYQQTLDIPWTLPLMVQPASLYQLIDVAAQTRTTGSFPPGERALCFALSDERHSVHFLIQQFRISDPPWIGLAARSDPDRAAFGIRDLDVASGRTTLHLLGTLASGQTPATLAIRPDGGRGAVLLETALHSHVASDLAIVDMAGARVIEDCPLPREATSPIAIHWGADDAHVEEVNLEPQPATWTLALQRRIWSESPGWFLRCAHRVDPSGAVVATIGAHALTLADGRYLSLLPPAIRGSDYFHSPSVMLALSCQGPFVADERLGYCAVALGGVLRVLDLHHHCALSPEPTTWFEQSHAQFLDDGDLLVTSCHGTTIVHGGMQRQIPVQDPIRALLAVACGTSVGIDGQDALRAIDLATGLGHQLMAGTPPNPMMQSVALAPLGTSALLCTSDRRLWLVQTHTQQMAWEMPCRRVDHRSQVAMAWNHDESIGYLAEDWVFGIHTAGACTGAWDVAGRRLLWRPTDASGAELNAAHALIPDPSSRRVLLQEFTATAHRPRRRQALQIPMLRTANYELSSGLLDGASGQWLRSVVNPGEQAGFTPDGLRLVGTLGVVDVGEDRMLQPFDAPLTAQHLWLSPSHTWALVVPPSGDWLLCDSARCGIRLRFSRPPPPLGDLPVLCVSWDRSEQHIAVGFTTSCAVFTMPLLPESCDSPGDGPTGQARPLAQLEAPQGWLPAATRLAALGEQGVSMLAAGAMTAHRLIALELCARQGERAADGLLDASGSLPAPLGYLAHDCAYRIHQLRLQQQAAGPVPAAAPHPPMP